MKPYEQLTAAGKLQRLRRLAAEAIERYDLRGARLTFLRQINNTLFRVDAQAHGRFLLRIHNLARHSNEEIRSEFVWLEALRREAHLIVPEPVPARDGSLWIEVLAEGVPEPRRCVLLRWVPGRRKISRLRPVDLLACGLYMARLHQHSAQWSAPEGFVRPRWDWNRLFGNRAMLWRKGPGVFSESDLSIFRAVSERLLQQLEQLGEGKQVFGLIHSDLHPSNFLFHRGQVAAIDFDDAGWGYYMFDMAVMLTELDDYRERSASMQAKFLEGYQRGRPLPEGFEQNLATFKAIRIVDLVNWVLGWETLTVRPWGPRFLRRAVRQLEQFLSR